MRPTLRIEIVTIFPGFFAGIFEHGIVRRALAEKLVTVEVHDLRAFTRDRHRTVDDRPFGGGEGMVLKPEPLAEALRSLGIQPKGARHPGQEPPRQEPPAKEPPEQQPPGQEPPGPDPPGHEPPVEEPPAQEPPLKASRGEKDADFSSAGPVKGTGFSPITDAGNEARALAPDGNERTAPAPLRTQVVLLSAQGKPFTQAIAREFSRLDRVVLICGRYEGVDERINLLYCDQEISIGDYVLSGGELAAGVVVDAVTRLLPGALGNEASREFESFGAPDDEVYAGDEGVPRSQHGAGGLLDYPHYTRPAEFAGLRAPEVLLNGDHRQIRRWRREQQLRKTLANRPELLERATLSEEDLKILAAVDAQSHRR